MKKAKGRLKRGQARVIRVDREAVAELLWEHFLRNPSLMGLKKGKKRRLRTFSQDGVYLALSKSKKKRVVYSMRWDEQTDDLTLVACRAEDYQQLLFEETAESIPRTAESLLEGRAYREITLEDRDE